jgi:basic membrane protein A
MSGARVNARLPCVNDGTPWAVRKNRRIEMKKLKVFLVVIAALAAVLPLYGRPRAEESGARKLKVALVLPGKKDDVSFNQAMYLGVKSYADEHADRISLQVVEEVYEVADIEPALLDFADQGYDVIFGHGFQFMEPIINVAPRYPKANFLLGTGYKSVDNSGVYDVHLQSGGYLMGVVAALATRTGKIGVIGGVDVSEIYRGHEAFKYAARQINPGIEIQEIYTGDWTDTAAAKEAAVGMYDSGVDIIWHSGDGIGLGVVQAAREKNKMCLGNVADQGPLAPNNVMTGVVYEWKTVIAQIFEDIENGRFRGRAEGNRFYWITAENGGLTYAPIVDPQGMLTDAEKRQIAEAYAGLKAGTVVIPNFEQ